VNNRADFFGERPFGLRASGRVPFAVATGSAIRLAGITEELRAKRTTLSTATRDAVDDAALRYVASAQNAASVTLFLSDA